MAKMLSAGVEDVSLPADILSRVREFGEIDCRAVLDDENGFRSVFRPGLMEAYSLACSDLGKDLWNWLRTGAPLGISESIPQSGIFPPVTAESKSKAGFGELVARINAAQLSNYRSFEDGPELSAEKLPAWFRPKSCGDLARWTNLSRM